MTSDFDRRELIALAGLGGLGIVFGSAVATPAVAQSYTGPAAQAPEDFFFIQLSDTHWASRMTASTRRRWHVQESCQRGQCALAPT